MQSWNLALSYSIERILMLCEISHMEKDKTLCVLSYLIKGNEQIKWSKNKS